MALGGKIAQNTIIHLAGKFLSLVLGLVAIAVMTRFLGVEKFGYYITVTAFLQFFGILVDFGLSLTTIQMISRPGSDIDKTMNNIMSLRLISAILFLALAPILIWFFPYNIFIKIGVLLTVASFFCVTVIQSLTGIFQQKLKMLEVTLAEVAGKIVFCALVVAAAILGKNIYWIFAAMSLGSIVNLILVFLYSRKYILWRWEIDFNLWKEIFRRSWPIALSISFNLIYLKMDTMIMSLTRSQSEVGLYGATYRVVDILTMLPAVFMGIVLPIMTNYFEAKDFKNLFGVLQKAFDVLMIFAIPIVLGTMVVGVPLMSFVAGRDFAFSGEILKVLILASGAIFVTSLFGYAVVGINKQKQMMWGYLATAVLTLAGYLIFIPKFGYWGAAWMTVFSEVLIMFWTGIIVCKTLKFFPRLQIVWKSLAAAIVMTGVLYVFRGWHVAMLLILAQFVYFSLLFLFKGIKKQEILELIGRKVELQK
ncbi:flippase [Patescibacteria group bacterium]|nr:flippase [Patescibacteria group bacterium]